MRFEGNINGYTIRSAGPDEIFDTADDIYLAGNSLSEYIIDGVKEMNASGKDLMTGALRVPFQEPNGYYKIRLPGKYSAIEDFDGWQSDVTFRYTADNTVTIVANPGIYGWDPKLEMGKRIRSFETGIDETYSGYKIVESYLINIDQAPGYEIVLQNDGSIVRVYEIMNSDGILFSISIVASGKDREFIMDTLKEALQTELDLR